MAAPGRISTGSITPPSPRPSPRPDESPPKEGSSNNNNVSVNTSGSSLPLSVSASNLLDGIDANKGKGLPTRERQASRGEAERVFAWSSIQTTGERITGRYGHTAVRRLLFPFLFSFCFCFFFPPFFPFFLGGA